MVPLIKHKNWNYKEVTLSVAILKGLYLNEKEEWVIVAIDVLRDIIVLKKAVNYGRSSRKNGHNERKNVI